ncbi:methionine--tRNA ligase [Buchnera aphidicola]|uniref:methionine--tRNA ligase n=1 Tax=Buchnera aphidicola TaxID=9 RepID=UPI0034643F68
MIKHKKEKMIVTCALPYANGPIHLGHILEHVQADIWVKYNRMLGNEVWFICADDSHGTPIMLKADEIGIKPKILIDNVLIDHKKDFSSFNIAYDNYHSTHSFDNLLLLKKIYFKLKNLNLIKEKKVLQFFDNKKKMFLPDRLIKGICPICRAIDQYGDACESCGSIYNALELIKPISVLTNQTPILCNSTHLFFDLPFFSKFLKNWVFSGVLQDSVSNKISEWFKSGLKQWDISRDAPYFGFKIPNYPGKFFYVWLDATIGYISTFKNLCNKNKNLYFDEFWCKNSKSKLYHFIGKDIIYFHGLFWPAILEAINFRKPTKIFVHGYLNINNIKLSKSKGYFIKARDFTKYLDSDCLRYYYATKSSSNINDINIDLYDLMYRFNSDIVNKLVNLASRSVSFINKYFNNYLSEKLEDPNLYIFFIDNIKYIKTCFSNRNFKLVTKKVMVLTDTANKYFDDLKPWSLINKNNENYLHNICSMTVNLFKVLITFLVPIMPNLANKSSKMLKSKLTFNNLHIPLLSHRISKFKFLCKRIDYNTINLILKK